MNRRSYLFVAALVTLVLGSMLALRLGDAAPCLDQILVAIKPAIESGPFP